MPLRAQHIEKPTPEEFLGCFPPQIQEIAHCLRQLVRDTVPTVNEAVYMGWQLIGYRLMDGKKGRYFCYIAPLRDQVRLGFEYGVLLANDHGLLEGSGKQMRYVSVRYGQGLPREALSTLIGEAATVTMLRP